MLAKLRSRAEDESGFTLIELLVVILIIGILAAVAIPTFLNQRGKAYDSNAQSAAKTAQLAEETYATSNNGSYTTSLTALQGIDASLKNVAASPANGNPGLAISAPSGDSYVITATAANTGDSFTLTEGTDGTTSYSCTQGAGGGNPGACPAGGSSSAW